MADIPRHGRFIVQDSECTEDESNKTKNQRDFAFG